MTQFKKGHTTNVGRHHSTATKIKISEANKGNHNSTKKFSEQESNNILNLYLIEKKPIRYISRHLNINRDTLKRFFKNHQIMIRTSTEQRKLIKIPSWRKIQFSKEDVSNIISMYGDNKSVREIALKFNCSISPITNMLHSNKVTMKTTSYYHKLRGFEPPSKINLTYIQKKEIKELWYTKKLMPIEIGKQLDIKPRIVCRELKLMGVEKKDIIDRRTRITALNRTGKQTSKRYNIKEETKELICNMYINELKSTLNIGNLLGYCSSVITRILKEKKVKIRSKFPYEINKETSAIIQTKYDNGIQIRLIAKHLKLPYDVVRYHLIKKGIKLRNIDYKRQIFESNFEEIKDLYYNHSWTFERLEKKYSLNRDSIRSYLLKKGLKLREERLSKGDYISKNKSLIIQMYNHGFSGEHIGKLFGTQGGIIRRFLRKWGIKISDAMFSRIIESDDGHKVRSSKEAEVDNWLFEHRIPHVYGKHIGDTKYCYDFFIPELNLYIEIWGLNTEKYLKAMKIKMGIYKELGFKLLNISPNDSIKEKLIPLLVVSRIQKKIVEYPYEK